MEMREQLATCLSGALDPARINVSDSRLIAVALATGRHDLLPSPYRDPAAAWTRLDAAQQCAVADANPAAPPPGSLYLRRWGRWLTPTESSQIVAAALAQKPHTEDEDFTLRRE